MKSHSKFIFLFIFIFLLSCILNYGMGNQRNLAGKTKEVFKNDKQEETELISNFEFFENFDILANFDFFEDILDESK